MSNEIFICLFRNERGFLGHMTAKENSFEKTLEDQKKKFDEEELESAQASSKFADLFYDFTTSMMNYVEFLPLVASMGPVMSSDIRLNRIAAFIKENGEVVHDDESRLVVRMGESSYHAFEDLHEGMQVAKDVGRQVPKMLLMGIVSSYEYHVAEFLRILFREKPHLLQDGDKDVKIREIMSLGSFDDFQNYLIEREVDLTMRMSADEQIKWLEKNLSIDPISKAYPEYPALMEIFERRNLFAHANGVVNKIYLGKSEKFGFAKSENPKLGQELYAAPKYFTKSLEHICDFGVKLLQVVWRKVKPEESFEADRVMGDFSLELISRGEYRLAKNILKFSKSLRGKREEARRRIDIVNLANAYRLMGDVKTANATLDAEDWSVVSDELKIGVAAVKQEVDELCRLVKKCGADGNISSSDYQSWPIFRGLEKNERFVSVVEETFSIKFQPRYPVPKKIMRSIFQAAARSND